MILFKKSEHVCVVVERLPKGQMRFYRQAVRLRASTHAVREAILRNDPTAAARVVVIPNPLTGAGGRWRGRWEELLVKLRNTLWGRVKKEQVLVRVSTNRSIDELGASDLWPALAACRT